MLNDFLVCPYRFYIRYMAGLVEDIPLNENLIWGDTFHKGLEILIKTKHTGDSINEALNHLLERYPLAPTTYKYSIPNMLRLYDVDYWYPEEFETEVVFEHKTPMGVILKGKFDATSKGILGEHKCKDNFDAMQIKNELHSDMQIGVYTYVHGPCEVRYDLIKIPESQFYKPQFLARETSEQYMHRIFYTHSGKDYPITRTVQGNWICQVRRRITQENISDFYNYTLEPLLRKLCAYYEIVSSPNFDPDNEVCYNEHFYKVPLRHFDPGKTVKFKGSYFRFICGDLGLEDLKRKELFSELKVSDQ